MAKNNNTNAMFFLFVSRHSMENDSRSHPGRRIDRGGLARTAATWLATLLAVKLRRCRHWP